MKQRWYLVPMVAVVLVACEKKENFSPKDAAPVAERIKPAPTRIEPVPDTPPPATADRHAPENAPSPVPSPAPVTPAMSQPPRKPAAREGIPVATQVEGKPGYVISPFSKTVIDVTGIPSGTLVQDPGYPPSEKKYFRVPQ